MTERIRRLFMAMIAFDQGKPALIQHFTKVHDYARLLALGEALPQEALETVEAAALVHDIAIPLCLEKYGSDAGALQEKEGPSLASPMLREAGFSEEITARVCRLVSMHHTYEPMDGIDHQILVEADFMVNSYENALGKAACREIYKKIFRTQTGRQVYRDMFDLEE